MLSIFQYQVHIFSVLEAVVEFADMRMIQFFLDLDLSFQDLLGLVLEDLLLRHNLQSIVLSGRSFTDQSDRSIRSFAKIILLLVTLDELIVHESLLDCDVRRGLRLRVIVKVLARALAL